MGSMDLDAQPSPVDTMAMDLQPSPVGTSDPDVTDAGARGNPGLDSSTNQLAQALGSSGCGP